MATKRRTSDEMRKAEFFDREHERRAHDHRIFQREQAANALRKLRQAAKREIDGNELFQGDLIFWARALSYHLDALEDEAVHDMRR